MPRGPRTSSTWQEYVMLGSGQINEPRQEMRNDIGIEMIMNAYWHIGMVSKANISLDGLYYSDTQ